MKKITLLFYLFCVSIGYSQTPSSAAPTPPARNATDVISIYGEAYSNIAGVNTNPNWGQSTSVSEIQIAGNNTLQYASFNYQGTDWSGNVQNISAMEFLHIDVWTNAQAPNVFAISTGPEVPHAISSVPGAWQSLDIPVAGLTGNSASVIQFKFDGGTAGTIYLDNLYFWKTPAAAGSDATLSDLKVDGTTVPAFSPGTTAYTYELVVGTTTVPQITAAITTDPSATVTSITQASGIPGTASVVVTSQSGSVTKTYTVSFAATMPNPSPTPSTPDAQVLNIYSDTGNFTNTWVPDYSFGGFASKPDLDLGPGVNEAIKMDFSTQGYGQGTNAVTDISSYNWLHFDYFADTQSNEIRFIVIGNNGGVVEYPYELTTAGSNGTLVQGSWQSVNVPLSFFENLGFNKTTFFQYKLGTTSNLVSKNVYFDNIYFSTNQGTVLNTNNFVTNNLRVYPNPAQNEWNISADNIIVSVKLFDVLGKEVQVSKPNALNVRVDASELSKGLYFANITTDNGSKVVKLIKN